MRFDEPNVTVNPRTGKGANSSAPLRINIQPALEVQRQAPRALVADDDPVIVSMLQRILRRDGYEVATARDGEEAWVLATTVDFDVLITDLDMPRTGGMELLSSVRKRKSQLPFIFVTGKPTLDTAMEAMNQGALAYIQKPFEPQQVLDAVSRATKTSRPRTSSPPPMQDANQRFDSALAGLHVHYQPIVRWSSQRAYSYEGLMRTSYTEVPHPGAFLDLAEALGRVKELGREVRGKAAKDIAASVNAPELVFVNLHPEELTDDELFDEQSPLSRIASRVFLEITERESLRGLPDVHERINALKQLGYRIAIDDIGAGYSGLNSFVDLEPHVVKVDMGLVRGIDTDHRRRKLVGSLLELAHDLGIEVVAEGVETPEERDALLDLGCDLFQGYLFSRPGEPFPSPQIGHTPGAAE